MNYAEDTGEPAGPRSRRATGIPQEGAGELSRAVTRAIDPRAADRGVTFSLSDDFDELLAVNESNRDNWDPLMPQFHPAYFDAQHAPAFWIKGVDRSGNIIAARGYRRFDLEAGRTLHDALTGLSLFYDDPAKARDGERVESSAATPHKVTGSFSFSGALWIHPNARGLGLASLMWPIGRSLVHDLWGTPLLFALVEDAIKMRAVLGFDDMESGIRWSGSYVGPRFDFTLVWWTRERIINDVNAFLRDVRSANARARPQST